MTDRNAAVVLLSGGLDSTTVLAYARQKKFAPIYALTFRYGQRHGVEVLAAARVAKAFGVGTHQHLVLDLDTRLFSNSELTGGVGISSPTVPPTYVPARNTVFLSLALAWAETLDVQDIFIGISSIDQSNYPDCRVEFINAYREMTIWAIDSVIRLHTPLIERSKASTIRLGKKLGVDYGMTTTCYAPSKASGLACGTCAACKIRLKGFAECGLKDPIKYDLLPRNT